MTLNSEVEVKYIYDSNNIEDCNTFKRSHYEIYIHYNVNKYINVLNLNWKQVWWQ